MPGFTVGQNALFNALKGTGLLQSLVPGGDPNQASTYILLHNDGHNATVTFSDLANGNFTFGLSAPTATATLKFDVLDIFGDTIWSDDIASLSITF